jgi:protein TonB
MKNMLSISLLAGLITFGLFVFMAFLVQNNETKRPLIEDEIFFDVAQTPPSSKYNVIERKPPTPPPVIKQPPSNVVKAQTSEIINDLSYSTRDINTGKTDISFNKGFGSGDAQARPVVQIPPKYPINAAQKGIEGWVKLTFNINKRGEVTHIKVIDSTPKRVFDKAAKQALKKWKYRAKKENGVTMEQQNLMIQLDFTMEKQQS